jgi:acyl dehydratase
MNYAAAIADPNPVYFDDERENGIFGPPLYAVALTWPITAAIGSFIQDQSFPRELLLTQVHYTEHIRFLHPLKPDGTLTVNGRIAAILPHRAGTHVVLRYDAADQAGQSIFTEHIGAMLRGVRCSDQGSGRSALPVVPNRPKAGPSLWEKAVPIEPLRPFIYDGCTNISFPIHTSPKFARQVGLPGIILQGTATLALAIREVINREAESDPLRLKALSCRFAGMVRPGTDIRVQALARATDAEGLHVHFIVINQEGRKAISDGYAQFRLQS